MKGVLKDLLNLVKKVLENFGVTYPLLFTMDLLLVLEVRRIVLGLLAVLNDIKTPFLEC